MGREKQGQCQECRLVYLWDGPRRLRDVQCPDHGTPLERVSTRNRPCRNAAHNDITHQGARMAPI